MYFATILVAQMDTVDMSEVPDINPVLILGPMLLIMVVLSVVFGALMLWGMFTKAGEPGWASMVPIYNGLVLMKIVGRPWWWVLLACIPLVGIIIAVLASIDAAKSFGKEAGFGVGIFLLPFIFLPILSWGSAQYQGPAAKTA